jgi:hypothetical protein
MLVHLSLGKSPQDNLIIITNLVECHFTSVILATWDAEIRRIEVQSQPRKRVHKTLS